MDTPDRLETLVAGHARENRDGPILGIHYIFWGVMNILGVWINVLVWNGEGALFWVFWVLGGIACQTVWLWNRGRTRERRVWTSSVLPRSWVWIILQLPLLIWVFPLVLHLYPASWIFSVTSAWIGLGSFATGMHTGRWSILVGSVAFWVAAPLYLLWPEQVAWTFTATAVLGLVVPGWVCLYEERT